MSHLLPRIIFSTSDEACWGEQDTQQGYLKNDTPRSLQSMYTMAKIHVNKNNISVLVDKCTQLSDMLYVKAVMTKLFLYQLSLTTEQLK